MNWPTATVEDARQSGAYGYPTTTRHSGTTLTDAVKRIPKLDGYLNPAWVEIFMGLPMGWTAEETDELALLADWPGWPAKRRVSGPSPQHPYEPPRVAPKPPHWKDQLRALGNAVVPAQAALAWRVLTGEFD